MAQDPFQSFFSPGSTKRNNFAELIDARGPADAGQDVQQTILDQSLTPNAVPDTGLSGFGETFQRSVQAGAENIGADVDYFSALFNTLTGDKEAAADAIESARLREEFAAAPLEGVQTWAEFIDEPTLDGFLTQVAKSGQAVPSAAMSIAAAGTGALVAGVGRGVLSSTSREVSKRLIKDSVDRTFRGVADPTEQQIAELAYGSMRDTLKRGAIGGALAAEYVPMAGSNLAEGLDSGQQLDESSALRAAAVAAPQAAIGVGGEYAFLKLLGEQAFKRSAVEGSLFANFAKQVGKGAAQGGLIESTTELAQEGISVANRADLDPLFTAEDAKLRLSEAYFTGWFSGAAPGAAGGAVGGALDAAANAPESVKERGRGALVAVADIYDQARRMLDSAREQRVNQRIDGEQFGDVLSGNTTPEPESDIEAQLRAMVDSSSGKNSVWVAGDAPKFRARTNAPTQVTVGGDNNLAFAAFIPGRGTIVSTDRRIVNEVIAAGASDKSLQIALGYSAVKSASDPGDTVVQVFDKEGRVISEEVTTRENVAAAYEAARKLTPAGGRIGETTVEKALEERRKRSVEVRNIELFESLPPDQQEELRRAQGQQSNDGQIDDIDPNEAEVDQFGQGIQAVEGQRTIVFAYGRKSDPNRMFDNTAKARANFESVFGETNWSDPRFAAMNESLLNAAANEQRSNPDSAVSIEDMPDGGFQLVRDDFGDLFRSINADGTETRLNVQSFLQAAIQRAKRSKYARNSRVVVVGPDGKKSAVNLVDLTAAGQRLIEGREGTGFMLRRDRRTGDTSIAPTAAARAGLLEILGDLAIEGYDVQIDGQSILQNQARIPKQLGNVTAAVVGTNRVSLNTLFRSPRFKQQTEEDRQRQLTAEALAGDRPTEVADGQSESDRMNESRGPGSNLQGDELPTRMNIETPRSAIDRRPFAGSNRNPVDLAIRGMVGEIINDLMTLLRFKNRPQIFTFTSLRNLTPQEIAESFPIAAEAEAVIRALDSMQSSSVVGKHISGPNGRKIIIYKESGNELQDAIVVAHEIGHSLYKEERDRALSNKALRERLINAYKRSSSYKQLSDQYGFDLGFEEWFSDQVALWANARYKQRNAKNMVEKFFKDFVARLRQLYRSLSESTRNRLKDGVSQDFETFMDAVLESRRNQVNENGLGFTEKMFSYELNDMAIQNGGAALAAHWKGKLNQILKNPNIRPLMRIVRTADGVLRMYAGDEIANMFYVRSQEDGAQGRLGMLRAAALKNNELQNKFAREIGAMDDPAVIAGMREAATSTPTAQLTGKARQIRAFLDSLYDDYIAPSNTDINRQADYFPVALNLMEVYGRAEEFIDLLVANGVSRSVATTSVNKLLRVQQAVLDDRPINIDPTNPASDVVQAIKLTKGVPRERLQQAGFLQEPNEAFINYIRHVVKRVEFDRHTKDADGNSALDAALARLNQEDRSVAEEIIATYLGYQSKPLSPFWRKLNSWGQFIQFITILPFATLASLTDLAGPIITSKEFGSITDGFKQLAATIKNRQEAAQFARDIGIVTNETVANAWVTEAEQDYMDPKVRKMSDAYFRVIGLNFFTNFSREFAAGMGVQFITKHARNEFNNPRSERYLRELGLTREDVLAWIQSGRRMTTPEGQKVKQGLQRFVESSILRPNAAERPIWASDPHWALVWQLKQYFYSYQKVILGGIKREALARLMESPNTPIRATVGIFALTAVATMPLAMLGLELREFAKNGLAWLLPGVESGPKYFRSDRMDWPEYVTEIYDRSGFHGAMAIPMMAGQASDFGNSPVFTLLGPTAETVDEAFSNGWRVDRTIKDRLLPIYNQL